MPTVDIVVVGASAGGLQALLDIVSDLPATLPAALIVVMHTPPDGVSRLPDILTRGGRIRASFAEADQPIESGHIYVAPPDRHLLVTRVGLTLNHGPRENGFRPAIDPLFRSAARIFGNRVMGVILSGALDDGAYGLKMIKERGGVAVVQDPEEAVLQSMPLSALQHAPVDHVLPAIDIAKLIVQSTGTRFEGSSMTTNKESEPQDGEEMTVGEMQKEFGPPSALTCPDCGGALWEIVDGQLVRYRCHTGHQYSADGLDSGQRDVVEQALWTAVRVLEEHADLRLRMSRRADTAGLDTVSNSFADSARAAHAQAQSIRDVLIHNGAAPASAPGPAQTSVRVRSSRSSRRHMKKTTAVRRRT
jgi:two-component system chemotaxis response regulator CheB